MPHNTREPLQILHTRTVVLPVPDVDTDQIIPARFLTTTTQEGLGKHAFNDWRYKEDGTPNPDFILNRPEAEGCKVLVAGRNFGCGSSREHAPWALLDYGLKAVISSEIADIFRSNSLKNGFLPIIVDEETHKWLLENPGMEITVDLKANELRLPGKTITFEIEPFARTCLLEGVDELGFLLARTDKIERYEKEHAA